MKTKNKFKKLGNFEKFKKDVIKQHLNKKETACKKDFFVAIKAIRKHFKKIEVGEDWGDIGNEFGIAIGKHIKKYYGKPLKGKKKENFFTDIVHGIKHGISLTDGTH